MTLLINNADVSKILAMEATIDALEASYRSLAAGEGGSTAGYFAIRIKSDVVRLTGNELRLGGFQP